jgi:hypothetical protein
MTRRQRKKEQTAAQSMMVTFYWAVFSIEIRHDVLDGWMLIQFIFQMDDFVFTETKNQATSHVDLRPYKGLSCSMYNVVCSVALGCNIIKLSQSKLIKRPSA